jgi:hypothetical protein
MQIKHKRTICSGLIAIIRTLFVCETVQTIQGEGEQALTLAKVRLMMTKKSAMKFRTKNRLLDSALQPSSKFPFNKHSTIQVKTIHATYWQREYL